MRKLLNKITSMAASAAVAVTSLCPVAVSTVSNAAGGGDDYARLLQYSLYFYDANYCGSGISEKTRLTWRGDCHTNDSVAGGFHDAGDHVKFGLPAGYTASNLGWSYYEFANSYNATGQTAHLKEITDHFAEFFRNSTTLNGDTVTNFVYQVGDGNGDHTFWRSPENDNDSWTRGALSTSNGASDIAAEYSAALALNYINFRNDEDLKYAKALYDFSVKYNTITSAPGFYDSTSLKDDQCWAAGWLYLATNDSYYKSECESKRPDIYWYNGWDNGALQANCVYGHVTGNWSIAESYLRSECHGTDYKFANDWGSARYNAELQFCALVLTKNGGYDFTDWSKNQMDYLIGNKGVGSAPARCFVVGFADNSVKYPHHRGASGFSSMDEFNNSGDSYSSNGHVLTGALVGGPTDSNGSYIDSVKDYQANEVALDYNAGLVGAAAGLYAMYGTGSTVPVSEIPEVKGGVTDPEPSETLPVTTATKKPVVTTTTTPVIITNNSIKITVDKTQTVNSSNPWEIWYWHELGVTSKDKVTKVEAEISAVSGNIGNWSGAFATSSKTGDWMQTDLSGTFSKSGVITWNVPVSDSEKINYDSGKLQFGTWWADSQSIVIDSITIYKETTEEITTAKPTTTTTKKTTTTTTKPTTTTTKKTTTTTTKPTTTTTKKTTTTTTKPTTTTTKKTTTTTAKPTTTTTKTTTTTAKPTTTTTKKTTTTTAKPTTTTTKKTTTTTAKPTTTTTTSVQPQKIKGDINNDGRVTVADLVALQYYILGRDKINSKQFSSADINNDGRIDTFDFVLLRKLLINS